MDNVVENRLYTFLKSHKGNLFAGGHDIHTPRELVESILSQIPEVSKDKTILVLFNVEFVISLVYTYKVNTGNITFYSDHENKTKMAQRLGVKVITALGKDMKFDVVIGNPPYQDGSRADQANKLWPNFVKLGFEMLTQNGYIGFITPNSWMQPTADIGKGEGKNSFSIFKDVFKQNNLILANVDSDNIQEKYFKGVGSTFSYYVCQKAAYTGKTKFIIPTGSLSVDISTIGSLPKIISSESLSISKKMIGGAFKFNDQNHGLNGVEGPQAGVIKTNKGQSDLQHLIYHTNKKGGTYWYGEKNNPYANKPKVIISLSGKYQPVFNDATGFSNMCLALVCEDTAHAKRAEKILSSKLYKFWVEMQKFSGFNPRKLILCLPQLPLNTDWDDQKIYAHFGLTQEEIDYIEANVK